jgi:hypothetical protein
LCACAFARTERTLVLPWCRRRCDSILHCNHTAFVDYGGDTMKTILTLAAMFVAVSCLAADSDVSAKISSAAKKLGQQPNYAWMTSTKEADGSPGRLSNIEGKSEKDSLNYLSFAVGGIPVEVYLKGTNGAAKALDNWMTLEEIAQTSGTAAAVVRYLRGYKTPAGQSAELAANVKASKEEDGALVAELKDPGFRDLLLLGVRQRDGQEAPKIEEAKGTAKFWTENGLLTKYEIHAEGKVVTPDRNIDVDRTMTVKIKDAGSTKLDPPAEAKAKL